MSYYVCLSICLPPAAAFHSYCQQGFGNNFRHKYTQSRVICQSVVVKVASHVCRSGHFAPVGFHGGCPEQRQGPAQLRVLRNSPRAMPLFGLPIIVMTALYTSRKQGKLQRACACRGPGIYVCRSGSFAHVIPLFHCHVYRLGLFAPVVSLFHCHGCRLWVSAPVVLLIELHGCRSVPSAPVVLHGCCPELRQGPAQLRVLRNSPRAMPLSGLPIIVMSARYTSRKQGKLQRACACKCHVVHGCRSGSFALVIPLSHCYVYRLGLSAPVVLYIDLHGCRSWVFAPVV